MSDRRRIRNFQSMLPRARSSIGVSGSSLDLLSLLNFFNFLSLIHFLQRFASLINGLSSRRVHTNKKLTTAQNV